MGRSDNALGDLWNVNKVTNVLFSIDSLCVWKLGNTMAFGGGGGVCASVYVCLCVFMFIHC